MSTTPKDDTTIDLDLLLSTIAKLDSLSQSSRSTDSFAAYDRFDFTYLDCPTSSSKSTLDIFKEFFETQTSHPTPLSIDGLSRYSCSTSNSYTSLAYRT